MKRRFEITFGRQFRPSILRQFCEAPESWFERFGTVIGDGDRKLIYVDNGSPVLGVAHLDHHGSGKNRYSPVTGEFWSMALDDRLGAYVLLDLLPRLGVKVDVLLTTGEESANSSAKWFDPDELRWNWMFQFDRRGEDVVTYQYDDAEWEATLKHYGFTVGLGSFSDICMLSELGICGVNIGVGYHDEHSDKCRVVLAELARQLRRFLSFYRGELDNKYDFTESCTAHYYSKPWYEEEPTTDDEYEELYGIPRDMVSRRIVRTFPPYNGYRSGSYLPVKYRLQGEKLS